MTFCQLVIEDDVLAMTLPMLDDVVVDAQPERMNAAGRVE